MTIKELRAQYNMTQKAFGEALDIPKRTIEEWEGGRRKPADYLVKLIAFKLENMPKK